MSFYHDQPFISPKAFQELLRERIAERKRITRETRQEGRRRILEMYSSSGEDPLDVFPEEIWIQIMEDFTPEDRWSTCQVHPLFANIMEDIRIRDILFPQVLKVLLTYLKNNSNERLGWNLSCEGNPRKPKLSIPIVKLRKVSKSLRLAIDHWFEENIHKELGQRREERDTEWKKLPRVVFYQLSPNTERLDGLIENYASAATTSIAKASKVFFLRSIEVIISPKHHPLDEDYIVLRTNVFLPFKSKMIKLLKLVGDQILFFKLSIDSNVDFFRDVRITVADLYFHLRQFAMLMPNLKRLDVCFELPECSRACGSYDEVPPEMVRLIKSRSFPSLSKLESLCIAQEQYILIAAHIYEAILKANPQVKILRLEMKDKVLETMSQQTLKSLNLEVFSWYNPAKDSSLHSDSIIRRNLNWPLKTLEMWPKYHNLNYVFKMLEKFPTLEKVMLSMVDTKIWIGTARQFLNLPNLTHFEFALNGALDYVVDDLNFLFSLQFLLNAKKLEILRWCYNATEKNRGETENLQRFLESHECPEKMLDFRGGWRDMNSSNIWRMFPELESVDIKFSENGLWKTVSRPN